MGTKFACFEILYRTLYFSVHELHDKQKNFIQLVSLMNSNKKQEKMNMKQIIHCIQRKKLIKRYIRY